MVEAEDIIKLKARYQTVQIEAAKAEERRKASKAALKAAREGLANLGIDPDEAADEIQRMYDEVEQHIASMEEWLGLA